MTYTAQSASESDVMVSIALAADGDTVLVPAGTATWNAFMVISKAITLKGAGVGQTNITLSCPDANSDGIADAAVLQINLVANKISRVSGISFVGTGALAPNGVIQIGGGGPMTDSRRMRFDHCAFVNLNGPNLFWYSALGVVDHCAFTLRAGTIGCYIYNDQFNSGTYSDESFSLAPFFGTDKFVIVEDCTITRPGSLYAFFDAYRGARYVMRHTTMSGCWIELHGTDSGGRYRGTRCVEVYSNVISDPTNGQNIVVNARSGTGVIYNNTISGFTAFGSTVPVFHLDAYRRFFYFSPFGQADGTNTWDENYAGFPFESGTASGGSSVTLVDNSKTWTTNQWVGYSLINLNSHTGIAGYRSAEIIANTATSITVAGDGTYAALSGGVALAFQAGDSYQIGRVKYALDMPGRARGTKITGDTPTPFANDQVNEPWYEWNNTATGGVNVQFHAGTPMIKENEHFFNDTVMPGYVPLVYPHPLVTAQDTPTTPPPTPPPTQPTGTVGGANAEFVCNRCGAHIKASITGARFA